jgi:hypothetical protein
LPKCDKKKDFRDVHVRTWTAIDSSTECSLNGKTNVKHFVNVRNKKLYYLGIEIKASIKYTPRKVKFSYPYNSSPDFTVAEEEWTLKRGIDDGQSLQWSEVALLNTGIPGEETIHVDIRTENAAGQDHGHLEIFVDA